MTKVDSIRRLLADSPTMSFKEIADKVGCCVELARIVKNGKYITPKKDAKARCLARNQELLKRTRRRRS